MANQLQMVIERGDHIVPNFEEIWPSDKNKDDKYKRRLIGMDYYMDAMENHGLKGHLPQPENFTTCGKLGIEINQYNCPIDCYDEAVIEEMTEDREMMTFDPRKSNVLTTLAAEERDKATRHA